MVRFPLDTSSAIFAWYLILLITLVYSSTKSPNSSLAYFCSSRLLTRPRAISPAASDSCFTERAMALIRTEPMKIVITTETNRSTKLMMLEILMVLSKVETLSSFPSSTYAFSCSPYCFRTVTLLSFPELTNSISLLRSLSLSSLNFISSSLMPVAPSSFS